MWIKVESGLLYNSEFLGTMYYEHCPSGKADDDVAIKANFLKDGKETCLGCYGSSAAAEYVIDAIFAAIARGATSYTMPSRKKMDFLTPILQGTKQEETEKE